MTDPFSVPTSWQWASFADVARVASNLVSPLGHPSLPHIAPNHIESETGRLLPYVTAAEDGVTSSKHLFESGHILYSKIRPYLAKVVHVNFEGVCSADMYPVEAFIDTRYLYWWLLTPSFTEMAASRQSRVVLPKINKEALGRLPVPVPPLAEQRRIVATLEEHLSHFNVAMSSIRAASQKQQILTSRFVDAQLDALAATEQPLLSLLREPLTNGRSVPTDVNGFPVLRLTALRNGTLVLSERKGGRWTAEEARPFLVDKGDFFLSRGNGSLSLVGRGALLEEDPDPLAFPDTMVRVRVDQNKILPRFLRLVWGAQAVRTQIERCARTTAGIYKINQRMIESIGIPVPDLDIQEQVVADASEALANIDQLGDQVRRATMRGESLRRSLLGEAFAGRLVEQDPADEPASVLLERIRAERAAQEPVRRKRGTKAAAAQRGTSKSAPQEETLL